MYYHMKVKLIAKTVIEKEKDSNEPGAKCFSDRETDSISRLILSPPLVWGETGSTVWMRDREMRSTRH